MRFTYSRKSILCLEPMVKLAALFCVLPNYNFKLQVLYRKKTNMIFRLLLTATIFSGAVYTFQAIYLNTERLFRNKVSILSFLQIATYFIGVVLFVISALGSFSAKANNWKELLSNFQKLEAAENLNTKKMTDMSILGNGTFSFAICSIIFLVLIYLTLQVNGQHFLTNLHYFGVASFIIYVELLQVNILSNLFICIKHKYIDINDLLMRTDTNVSNIMGRIRKVEKLYLMMDRIIELVNGLFGWIILTMIFHVSLLVLSTLTASVVINTNPSNVHGRPMKSIIADIVYRTFSSFQIGLIVIVIFCIDAATKEPQKLIDFCMNLEGEFPEGSEHNRRLKSTVKKLKYLSPKITAAGFFPINRSTLLAMISVITTYFIVIVEFYIS
ncbi:uncharacterized protein [Leptinotarsa decemlineata]|uniref:uncharacterized protein n=1 Tax=Leptinotarsa decemlineata TaxID=7539 RepID=UPI003D30802F